MSDFWARKLGVTAPPPANPQPVAQAPVSQGAWWQSPASPHAQQVIPPETYQQANSGGISQYTYQQLKAMRVDEMTQEQMEQLALLELQEAKYNQMCPNCGSGNFLPQGTKVRTGTGTIRMGTDKCFDCGASSSTLTESPAPAVSGRGRSAGHATKQTEAGGRGSYGRHHSQLPQQYLPRNA